MSLILWVLSAASAGTLLNLTSDPALSPEEGESVVPAAAVVPDARYTPIDAHATRQLGTELLAVRPLMHKFDGELEIMSRLDAVVSELRVVRDLQERRLLYQALAFEGFAVERYFQDGLGSEPAAEPYRVVVGDRMEVKAWVDAVALDPYHEPVRADISEEPELAAFRATRDRLLYAAPAMIALDAVPADAEVVLDGQVMMGDPAAGFRVYPGRHWLLVSVNDVLVEKQAIDTLAGESRRVRVAPSRKELDDLGRALALRPERVTLTEALFGALAELPAPLRVAATAADGGEVVYYRLSSDELHRIDPEARDGGPSASVWLSAGGGWVRDPAFTAAPDGFSGLNAGAVAVGARLAWDLRSPGASGTPWSAVVGLDLLAPGGAGHEVVAGDTAARVRAAPYAAFGVPWLQGGVGALLPGHVAVTARARAPLRGEAEVEAFAHQALVAFRSDVAPDLATVVGVGVTVPLAR